jgi:hypothetical protein
VMNELQEQGRAVPLVDGVDAWITSLASVDVNELRTGIMAARKINDDAMYPWFELEMALNRNVCPCPHCSRQCELSEPPGGLVDVMFDFICQSNHEPQRDVNKLIKRVRKLYKQRPQFSKEDRVEIVMAWARYRDLQEKCSERAASVFRLLGLRDLGQVCAQCHEATNDDANERVFDLIWHCIRYASDFDAAKILAACVEAVRGKENSGCKVFKQMMAKPETPGDVALRESQNVA